MTDVSDPLRSAPREALPSRDLWPGVASRIRRTQSARWLRAAAAVVLFGAGALTGTVVERRVGTPEPASADTSTLYRLAALQRAGSEYVAAVAQLRHLGSHDEALRAQGYETALGVVSVTAQEVTTALDLGDAAAEGSLVSRARAMHAAASRRASGLLQGRAVY